MASRYPLVINNTTSLVGELPVGDSLNLSASGIFDGIGTGSNGQILSSNNGTVRWARAADVFKDDTQTLTNKTLRSCIIDSSLNVITNISNSSLVNSSININGTSIPLGGSISIPDTNDNTLYSISVADGVNATQKRIRLTAGGSGSGIQDIFLTTGNYLSISRSNNDTLNFSISIQNLTVGSYLLYDNSATTYNGLNARTISVNATTTNTANRVVARDANGNFSAGTITASLIGDVTGDVTGNISGNAGSASKLLISGANSNSSFTDYQIVLSPTSNGNNSCYTDPQLYWNSSTNILGVTGGITTLGNLSAANITGDDITGDKFIRTNGLSSQFLKADGSIDSNAYITLSQVPTTIPSGSVMIFRQATAPTGWTQQTGTALNNAALRVVTGSGGGTGGSNNFTDVLNASVSDGATSTVGTLSGSVRYTGSHTLTTSQLASHSHGPSIGGSFFIRAPSSNGEAPLNSGGGGNFSETFGSSGSTNSQFSSGGHNHSITSSFSAGSFNLNVKYVDVIIARKD